MNDICDFVNGNDYNVNLLTHWHEHGGTYDDVYDVVGEFERRLTAGYAIDTTAFPVLVYRQGSKEVAWYDIENLVGYIA